MESWRLKWGNQDLRDAKAVSNLLPVMVLEFHGSVTDKVSQKHLLTYENKMIYRGF